MTEFESELNSTLADEKTVTENGAIAFSHTSSKLLDINFAVSSLRRATDAEVTKAFADAFYECPMLAVKWLFFARDVREGMGERRLFRLCMQWLASVRPALVKKLIPLVKEYGRFDDLICLLDCSEVKSDVSNLISHQLSADISNMQSGKQVSLLAKWLPSVNASSRHTVAAARSICKILNISERQYRKMLSALRKRIDIVEAKMSANEWSKIDYEHVPSRANVIYSKAFVRNDATRRNEFLSKVAAGKAEVHSAVNFPCDVVHMYSRDFMSSTFYCSIDHIKPIVQDPTTEALWKALPDFTAGLDKSSTIVVADSSGSMLSPVGNSHMTAMEVAYSLAIYFAEKLTGPFKDKTITFSGKPQYLDMSNAHSLAEKLSIMTNHSEVANTNIEAVFDLLLKTAVNGHLQQSDIPNNVLIVSDMEYDNARSSRTDNDVALFEAISKKWTDAGYQLPRLIFWNVNSRTIAVPLTRSSSGVVLVSGYSAASAKMVFSVKLDPYEVLIDALNTERYAPVETTIKDLV